MTFPSTVSLLSKIQAQFWKGSLEKGLEKKLELRVSFFLFQSYRKTFRNTAAGCKHPTLLHRQMRHSNADSVISLFASLSYSYLSDHDTKRWC